MRAVISVVVAAALALVSASAALAGCKDREGDFTSILIPPPACTSPVGVCTLGTLTGEFPSSYNFTMDTLVPAGDPAHPDEFAYTGHSVITDAHGGVIFGSDSGVIFINGPAPAPFVTTVEIVGGTRGYKKASGNFVATGVLDFVTGDAVGTYTSTICKGNGHGGDD
jgi:hypothetical protein